jgi:hypothetical protein
MWGARVRNTKLPANMGHMLVILRFSQIFQGVGSKRQKAREARERKRVQQVAELVRDREAARKRAGLDRSPTARAQIDGCGRIPTAAKLARLPPERRRRLRSRDESGDVSAADRPPCSSASTS